MKTRHISTFAGVTNVHHLTPLSEVAKMRDPFHIYTCVCCGETEGIPMHQKVRDLGSFKLVHSYDYAIDDYMVKCVNCKNSTVVIETDEGTDPE